MPKKGGGISNIRCSKGHENLAKYYEMLTKLILPNLQVTLSQVPPSQKETWGAEGAPCFHACPRANSKRSFVACEPADVLH